MWVAIAPDLSERPRSARGGRKPRGLLPTESSAAPLVWEVSGEALQRARKHTASRAHTTRRASSRSSGDNRCCVRLCSFQPLPSKPHRHRPSGRPGTGEGSPDGPSSCRRLDLEKPQTQLGSVSEAALILCRAWGKPNSKIVSSSEGFEAKVGSQEHNYSSFEKQLLVYFLSLVD